MKCLFIGGHATGRVIDVDLRMPYVDIPIIPKTPAEPYASESASSACRSIFEFERYKIDCVIGKDGERRYIYVADGSADPIDLLLDFYASQPHPEAK